MALPKLNNTLKYELTIPSTNKKVRFRPFLVKEEKNLMIAMESKNSATIIHTLLAIIKECVDDDIVEKQLATFDVEHMFLRIRSKSVGESSKVAMKCSECNETTETVIPIDDITVDVPKIEKTIQLTDDISVEVDWPTYAALAEFNITDTTRTEDLFKMMAKCFKAIITDEERINVDDVPLSEVEEFIESMSSEQFLKIQKFAESVPRLKHELEFKCEHCGHDNKVVVEGLEGFLS